MSIREDMARNIYWHFGDNPDYVVSSAIPLFPIDKSNRVYASVDQILDNIRKRIEAKENPYEAREGHLVLEGEKLKGFERAREDFLKEVNELKSGL